jgi:aspartate/methionine/tyrosine aminotransferase
MREGHRRAIPVAPRRAGAADRGGLAGRYSEGVDVYLGAIPEPYRALGSLEFAKQLLAKAKVSVSPGIGFGDYGDEYVRFALIENESRIRQAVRGIKAMFRADGLVKAPGG